jgi:hypothetical protein
MAEAHDSTDPSEPPEVPEVTRRVRLYGGQWVGIPLLILIPVLAVLSVFGETRDTVAAASPAVRLQVDYPARVRSGQQSGIEVRLRNVSGASLDGVTVTFDPAYFERFARVSFMPQPGAPYEVELTGLDPGGVSVLRVEFEGDRPWRSRGHIEVGHGGARTRVMISTFTFP